MLTKLWLNILVDGFNFKKETGAVLDDGAQPCRVLEFGHFGAVEHTYLESLEILCWRRMVKISWTDRVRNEELLRGVKGERDSCIQ